MPQSVLKNFQTAGSFGPMLAGGEKVSSTVLPPAFNHGLNNVAHGYSSSAADEIHFQCSKIAHD